MTTKLPEVCKDEFDGLFREILNRFNGPMGEDGDTDEFTTIVAVWARRHHLDADWFIDRLFGAVSWLHQDRFRDVHPPGPLDPRDPLLWTAAGQDYDMELVKCRRRRIRGRYGRPAPPGFPVLAGSWPPNAWTYPADDLDSPALVRLAVLAWPDIESREEFQKRALAHYALRAVIAKREGLTLYRKAPALERHVVWLLQQRVLRMTLDSIADLAQQDRVSRRGSAGEAIDARSVSREIKRLEELLPL